MWLSDFENAWQNFLDSVRGDWNAWETSRFGTLYNRRGVAARVSEKRQRSEREDQRASEERRNVLVKSLWSQSWLCYRQLESVVCSSTNIATESTVELCENPRRLSSLSPYTTVLLWTMFGNIRGHLDSTGHWDKGQIHHWHWDITVCEHQNSKPVRTIVYVHLWISAYCILWLPLSLIDLSTIVRIWFIVQDLSSF